MCVTSPASSDAGSYLEAGGSLNETTIEQFWDAHPCGDHIVGGLTERFAGDYERFFTEYDAWRYDQEGHILECLDGLDCRRQGRPRDRARRGLPRPSSSSGEGAHYSGLDLTSASIQRVAARFALRDLPFDDLRQGSALEIPWPDDAFDLVFSHGVLHHIPDIDTAQREIHRVLRPGGELVVMLYARRSLNYQVSIRVLRRAALAIAYPLARAGLYRPRGIVAQHIANARKEGLGRYLRLDNFVHRSTDGPLNPFARCTTSTRWRPTSPTSRSRSPTSGTCTRRRCPSRAGHWAASSAGTSGSTSGRADSSSPGSRRSPAPSRCAPQSVLPLAGGALRRRIESRVLDDRRRLGPSRWCCRVLVVGNGAPGVPSDGGLGVAGQELPRADVGVGDQRLFWLKVMASRTTSPWYGDQLGKVPKFESTAWRAHQLLMQPTAEGFSRNPLWWTSTFWVFHRQSCSAAAARSCRRRRSAGWPRHQACSRRTGVGRRVAEPVGVLPERDPAPVVLEQVDGDLDVVGRAATRGSPPDSERYTAATGKLSPPWRTGGP